MIFISFYWPGTLNRSCFFCKILATGCLRSKFAVPLLFKAMQIRPLISFSGTRNGHRFLVLFLLFFKLVNYIHHKTRDSDD